MAKFSVIYDANVPYPAPLRDLLMRLALTDLFKAHWTAQIHNEWIEALLRQGKHKREQLEHVRNLMDSYVRDALITSLVINIANSRENSYRGRKRLRIYCAGLWP